MKIVDANSSAPPKYAKISRRLPEPGDDAEWSRLMGLWPFGSEPEDVELATRVVTATCRNQSKVRGKLMIHFEEARTQRAADEAADTCAAIIEFILSEANAPIEVLGNEAKVIATLHSRLLSDFPKTRLIELASLHVPGMPAVGPKRSSSVSHMPAVQLPQTGATPTPGPVSVSASMSSRPPSATTPMGLPRRPASTRMRAISADLLIPQGAPPDAIAHAVSPLVRDSAARLLVGVLRAHDLLVVRGLGLDEGASDILAALVPVSDSPPGGYEASRAAEIARWEAAMGEDAIVALRRELSVVVSYLLYSAMLGANVTQAAANAVLQAVTLVAFPTSGQVLPELGRYLHPVEPSLAAEVSANVARVLGREAPPTKMDSALTPVLAALGIDLGISASLVKYATS